MKRLVPFVLAAVLIVGGAVYFSQSRQSVDVAEEVNLDQYELATFAGGCFWCTEADFEKTDGVIEAISGFTGGQEVNPAYKQVAAGQTGHREAVQVYYDPEIVSYEQLLTVFWRHIDPTDNDGQFVDRGPQYAPGVFVHTQEQKEAALRSKQQLSARGPFDEPIVVRIVAAKPFYPAEESHQDYYKKNPVRYNYYRGGSGRDAFINEVWGDGLKEAQYHRTGELRSRLTLLQFEVTQNDATEPPFDNAYWDNKEEGIYVDIIDGTPLFSSTHKFESGTGWPSFTQPISKDLVTLHDDFKLLTKRIEVRSKKANSHLGHIFNDAPEELGGVRWCINSASLKFIPKDELTGEYSEFLTLFD